MPSITTRSVFSSSVSITVTKRRRFLWAAWWTAPPAEEPFRKPDASSGGARSREEALAAAELAAGRSLTEIEPRWAVAWARVLRGSPPWPTRRAPSGSEGARAVARAPAPAGSKPWAFALLRLEKDASVLDVKRAFRAIALRAHPDHGGDDAAFIEAKRAYDVALAAAASRATAKKARSRRRR